MSPEPGVLVEDSYGPLSIWRRPVKGAQYSIGVDTSSGVRENVRRGDPSAACVIEMHTCEQVAEMHGFFSPDRWGYMCCRLAAYYNRAVLCIETHPSQHGLLCFDSCERYGYDNLFMQVKEDVVTKKVTTRRGWTRGPGSTVDFLNRIRVALGEGCPIRSGSLLDELANVAMEEMNAEKNYDTLKAVARGHQDRVIAYAISLKARDQAFRMGEVKPDDKPIMDLADLDWKMEAELATAGGDAPFPDELNEYWNSL